MPYATLPVAGGLNGTNVLTSTNRPAGTVGMGILGPGGGFKKLISFGNVPGSNTPGTPAAIAETVSLNVLQAKPGSGEVVANVQYACSSDLWNNAAGGTVWVLGLKTDAYWPVGIGTVNGTRQLVTIDVAAATYVPFAGGAAGPLFDPYDVSLAIRQAVVDGFAAQDAANNDSPFLDDPQPAGSLVGMDFPDPDNGYNYVFKPVPFANGTVNVWTSYLLSR